MTSTPDLAALAGRLSEAQREAILRAPETLFGDKRVLTLRNRWSTKVIMNLRKKGVCEPDDITRDRLTPLGEQVRLHLKDLKR
jgi:hypothetical protein